MVRLRRVSIVEKYILESKDLTLEAKKDLDDLKEHLGDDLFDDYMKIRNRIADSDWKNFEILKNKDPEEVRDFVDNFQSESEKRKEAKKGAKKLYENSDWIVYKITTYPAAQYYGKNTKWCITGRYPGHEGRGEEYFNDYISDNNLDGGYYFYINKNDDYEKYCVLQTNDGEINSIWNASDTNKGTSLSDLDVKLPEIPEVNLHYYLEDDLEDLIRDDYVDDVEEYLEENEVVINRYFSDGSTPLTCSIENECSTDMIDLLLSKGADVNKCTNEGTSPLYLACDRHSTDIVKLLLKNGADPNKASDYIYPIFQALRIHHAEGLDLVKLLIQYGADVNKVEKHTHCTPLCCTPLGFAIARCETDSKFMAIVELLLNNGAKVNGYILNEIVSENYKEVLEKLLKNGMDADTIIENKYMPDNSTSLHIAACMSKGVDIIKLLIQYGADVNKKNEINNTPLFYSCMYDFIDNARVLLENGADPNILGTKQTKMKSPLACACEEENMDLIKLLVKYGAKIKLCYTDNKYILLYLLRNVNIKDSKSRIQASNLLLDYAFHNNCDMMEALIDAGVDVNSEDSMGNPILHGACLGGALGAAKLLIKNGADVNKKDYNNTTCLSNAVFSKNKELVDLLIKNGIDINHQGKDKLTALRNACMYDNYDMVELLLKNGADVNVVDYEGKTPMQIARSQKIKDLLAQYGAEK